MIFNNCFNWFRSHAVFTVWLKIVHTDHKGVPQIKKAKLNLVDLAGSERHGKTGNQRVLDHTDYWKCTLYGLKHIKV